MAFKLYSDAIADVPFLACDVCGQKIIDLWSGKATGSPGTNGQVTDVKVHHEACVAAGAVQIALIEFLRLFVTASRIGNLASNGTMDKITVEYPTGKGFEK